MIFLVQFGINKHSLDHKLHSPYGLVSLKKFTRAYFYQIALEIMWLPILILHKYRPSLQLIDRWGMSTCVLSWTFFHGKIVLPMKQFF